MRTTTTSISPSILLGRRRVRALGAGALTAAVLAGQAMASLDTAIVNVAAPAIKHDLRVSAGTLQLAVYAYLLTYATSLITAARLGARRGFGAVFTAGVGLFTVSSLACGLSIGPAMLVSARAVQGVGAALMVAQVLAMLQTALDGDRRSRALSLYGMVLAVGVAAGQVLGGVLVSADLFGTGWRPIFLVNVPIGLCVLLFAGGRLPAGSRAGAGRPDVAGALALAGAMLALLIPLSFGAGAGWPAWCWPALATGVALLGWFNAHGRRLSSRGGTPMIEPSLFGAGGVRVPLAGVFAMMCSYGGLLFTIALYLQGALHESALQSGLTFAAYAGGFATASLTWTRLPRGVRAGVPSAGFAVIAAAEAALALAAHAGWPIYATALLALAGAAHGAGFGALVRQATNEVVGEQAAALSGVLATVNQLAIAVGIAVAGTAYVALGGIGPVLLAIAAVQAVAGAAITIHKQVRPRSRA